MDFDGKLGHPSEADETLEEVRDLVDKPSQPFIRYSTRERSSGSGTEEQENNLY